MKRVLKRGKCISPVMERSKTKSKLTQEEELIKLEEEYYRLMYEQKMAQRQKIKKDNKDKL